MTMMYPSILYPQVSSDGERRREVLEYHLVHRPWGKKYPEERFLPSPPAALAGAGQTWSQVRERQSSLKGEQLDRDHYHLIQIIPGQY